MDRPTSQIMHTSSKWNSLNAFLPARPAVAVFGATLAGAALLEGWSARTGVRLHAEGGLLEVASVVVLGAAAILGVAWAFQRPTLTRWAGAAVLAVLVLRELDFQRRFTYRSIESIGFYTRPIASVEAKIVALSILLSCAVALAIVARAAWRRWREVGDRTDPAIRHAALAAAFVGSALVSEKFLGLLVAEESFELAFAGAVLALAWSARPWVRQAHAARDADGVPAVQFADYLERARAESNDRREAA